MNFFDFSLRFKGFPIQEAKRLLATIQKQNESAFNTYLEHQKQAIVDYHLRHNCFYRILAKHANPLNWDTIPVMTKRDLQQPLKDRLSDGYTLKNSHIHKTSGSSGDPFIFAKDKFCHALTWAGFMTNYSQFNIDVNASKQARFYGIPLNKKGYYKERIKDSLGNRYRFSVFDLSDTKLEKNLNKFKTTAFDYINGYTSAIVEFAKYLQEQSVVLKTVCPTLKGCIVTSEMLFEADKILLEQQFGIPVINEYGAAELGLIAFPNTKGEWLVNSSDLYIEILDDNNNILPYGETGRVVITSLYNKAHPFIRYDLGDMGALSKSSTLQRPILETLVGRADDIVQLPSGKKAAGLTFYYVTKTVIENSGNVKAFIIEQLRLDTFKISYVSNFDLSEKHITDIKAAVSKYLEPGLSLIFERKSQLKRAKSGKLKQFTSHI